MSTQESQHPEFITRRQAAELIGRDMRTIDRWANEGRLTRYKQGGLQWVVFRRDEVLAMVAPVAEASGE